MGLEWTGLLPSHSLLNQRYRILRSLGQGGMGAFYQAADTRLGDRSVAWSPDDTRIASTSRDTTVKVWRAI